ncbi:dnaI protein [Lactobacillus selangorensis]|uniref:DnaI protein n=1 Tax=Lactobacillus selangorensis TaxID=81857 RepID=A0A0R2FQ07_9LACO|nr:primosomal protein DnaI [Lactobacillus selangorensis]KRN29739.1 dnaI protein [Lactobacillus selangorensis]KRN33732.1 dnaI protein [Lactobacillus selangorensis]
MEDLGKSMQQTMNRRNWNKKFAEMVQQSLQDPDVQAFLNAHKAEMTPETLDRSAAKIYEYVLEKNKLAHGEPTFAPGYAPKLVMDQHLIDVTYVPTTELQEKRAVQTLKNRVQRINMPKDIADASLLSYDPTGRSNALQAANQFFMAYVNDPKTFHPGLYLTGPFGVGKTYLLGALANALAEKGFRTTLLHFPTFAVEMKNAIKDNNVQAKIDRVKKAPILMLDDIGAGTVSAWVRDEVLGIILQYRMQEQLPTFFSSNETMDELTNFLTISSQGDNEPLKAKRIMERVRYLSRQVVVQGPNRRLENS